MWLFLNVPGHNEKDFIALGIIKVDSNSTQRLKITLIFLGSREEDFKDASSMHFKLFNMLIANV